MTKLDLKEKLAIDTSALILVVLAYFVNRK